MKRYVLVSSLALGLAACGATSEPLVDETGEPAGKNDSAVQATLRFDRAGSPLLSGTLVGGQTAKLVYDLDRIVGCRSDAWAVTAYVLADGETEPQTLALSRLDDEEVVPVDAHFTVPNTSQLAVWFTVHDAYGCLSYDSNESANYQFAVTNKTEATIRFANDWSETVQGALVKNGIVHLDYDLARMPTCTSSTPFARYRLDGGSVRTAQLFSSNASNDNTRATADLALPQAVSTLEVWFERTSRYGCNETDSDFGNNYRFTID